MDTEKLLIQDNPPTREEFNTLNQGVKNWTLYALVRHDAVMNQFIQAQPYTAVEVVYDAGDKVGDDTYTGTGFSKVCWPDVFCAKTGLRIARMRAIRKIVKALLAEGIAYDTLVNKWDRYLDAAKDILSVFTAMASYKAGKIMPWENVKAELEDAEVSVDLAETDGDGL